MSPLTKSFISALLAIVTVVFLNHPTSRSYLPRSMVESLPQLLILGIVIFISQSIIDIFVELPNKMCKFIDLLSLTAFAMVAHLIFQLIQMQGLLMLDENPMVKNLLEAGFVGLIVFGFRHLISDLILSCH